MFFLLSVRQVACAMSLFSLSDMLQFTETDHFYFFILQKCNVLLILCIQIKVDPLQ